VDIISTAVNCAILFSVLLNMDRNTFQQARFRSDIECAVISIITLTQELFKRFGNELFSRHESKLATDHPSRAACALSLLYRSIHTHVEEINKKFQSSDGNVRHSPKAFVSKSRF